MWFRVLMIMTITVLCFFWFTQIFVTIDWLRYAGSIAATAVTGVVLYPFASLRAHAAEETRRTEMVRVATVAEERRRFSRDLHDLMGHGMSTVVLKGELAAKVAESDPRRARGELEDIIRISRDLLTNVREVAHGQHRMSLDAELESVVSTMTSLGVEVDADISHDTLDADTSTVLAIVLREGVTNLLTHGRGRRCEIRTRSMNGKVVMILTNECVAGTEGRAGGSGLESLAARVSAVNGQFHSARSGNRFILGVEIPQGVFGAS